LIIQESRSQKHINQSQI